ncbi:MAG: isoleucine--tRNA ligase, partial [Gammaproteobacteria bacterium]|nr:isoleucine--tRNA ligase [Gammaproteobacteria bacterium]
LSFTANEIWQTLGLETDKTVFEDVWYELPQHGLSSERISVWEAVIATRGQAAKEIEILRAASQVGSSLQAELELYLPSVTFDALNSLGDDLRFAMITSSAKVYKVASDAEQKILVSPSAYKKCDRCWHYRADVGSDAEHPHICGRCVSNLFGKGEVRKYA